MFIVAVPARLKSSRIESKLLIEINDKPMIIHTLKSIEKAVPKESIHVFCDTEILRDTVEKYGYKGFLVLDKCENGTERISKGIKLHNIRCEYVMIVHGDQPCLDPENIRKLTEFWNLSEKDKDTMYTLHTQCDSDKEDLSIAKIAMTTEGKWLYISRRNIPSDFGSKEKVLHKHASLCMFHIDLLDSYSRMKDTPLQLREENEWLKLLENGYNIKSVEVEHHERDLNTPEDLRHIIAIKRSEGKLILK